MPSFALFGASGQTGPIAKALREAGETYRVVGRDRGQFASDPRSRKNRVPTDALGISPDPARLRSANSCLAFSRTPAAIRSSWSQTRRCCACSGYSIRSCELVEMHYLQTPVILDDSSLRELLPNAHATAYDDGIAQTLASMKPAASVS